MNYTNALALIENAASNYDFNKDDHDDITLYILEEARKIKQQFSLTLNESLAETFGSRFSFDGNMSILMLDEPVSVSYDIAAIFYLIALSEPMKGHVCTRDVGIYPWSELEDNDDEWFYQELLDYGLVPDSKYYYLIKIKNIDANSETYSNAIVEADEKKDPNLLGVMYAQYFYNGYYSDDRQGFLSQDVLTQEDDVREISKSQFETLQELSIANYLSSFEEFEKSCNMNEVDNGMSYYD